MKMFGGIEIGDEAIGVTHMPDRKRPCLYYQNGCVIYPLAYFTNEEYAEIFWEQFKRLVFGQTEGADDETD